MSWFFASGGQSIGVSASASVLPVNIQDWFPLGSTGLIYLQSKGLSRVFSNTTVQKHQFFGAQPSLWSNSHICTLLLEEPTIPLTVRTFVSKVVSLLFNTLSMFDDELLTHYQYQMREWRDVSAWGFPGPEWLSCHLSTPRAGFLACAPCQSWRWALQMSLWALDCIPGPELPGHCRVFTSQSLHIIPTSRRKHQDNEWCLLTSLPPW